MGPDRRSALGDRFAAVLLGPCDRAAATRPRDLASLPQGHRAGRDLPRPAPDGEGAALRGRFPVLAVPVAQARTLTAQHTRPSSPRNGFAVVARGAARLRGVSKDAREHAGGRSFEARRWAASASG